MSKEQLEELLEIHEKAVVAYEDWDFLEMRGYLETLFLEGFIDYLIEQAERVQELEELNRILSSDKSMFIEELVREQQQNKRYREALEFYGDKGTYEVAETLPPTDEYQQPIEPVFKTVPIIYYDKGITARKALEE